jgi:hypothetical protein
MNRTRATIRSRRYDLLLALLCGLLALTPSVAVKAAAARLLAPASSHSAGAEKDAQQEEAAPRAARAVQQAGRPSAAPAGLCPPVAPATLVPPCALSVPPAPPSPFARLNGAGAFLRC